MKYFRGGRLARMSDGSYCIIRDLGLVKGGKGLRHFECILRFGIFSKLVGIALRANQSNFQAKFLNRLKVQKGV